MNRTTQTQSQPVSNYTIGQTVLFRYALSSCDTELFTGRIAGTVKESALWGRVIYIEPVNELNPYHVPPRHVSLEAIKRVVETPVKDSDPRDALYDAMKQAEAVHNQYALLDTFDMPADHATYKRKVKAHIAYLKAQEAYTGVSNSAKIVYLYGPQNAPQSPQNGPNGDIEAIQAYMRVMGTQTPPIAPASEETLNLEGLTWWQRDEARAAYWSKKSVKQIREGYTPLPDAETLKVKRDAQHDAAYLRIYGVPFTRKQSHAK